MVAAKGNRYAEMRLDNPAYKPEQIKELCEDLLHWAEHEKDLRMIGWARRHERTKEWINHLARTYPDTFGVAHKHAMELLGRKMLNASFYGEGNATVGLKYLGVYDKDFKDFLEWQATLNKDVESSAKNKTIIEALLNAIKSNGSIDKTDSGDQE